MLYLTFLWHMHQPWYLDPERNRFALPWVRLHGTKDYLDMAELIREFPSMRAVFNLTPCLIEQLELYLNGAQDEHQALSLKPVEELTETETQSLIWMSFWAHPQRMIQPFPRYAALWDKAKQGRKFSTQELRDLQVWSNLCWIDPRWRREIPELPALVLKGSQFTEEEKQNLLNIQLDLLRKILPTYRALFESGQAELSVSPFAHPILPLLYDAQVARHTHSGIPLPSGRWHFPEDVEWHLKAAAGLFLRIFGSPVRGVWPSEGAVSHEILPFVQEAGFTWLATDEEILFRSLKGSGNTEFSPYRSELYRPYRIAFDDTAVTVVFRDRILSDLIGFVYAAWPEEKAVDDFIKRLKAVDSALGQARPPPLVLVALDGENPWESYREDGEPFLRKLYKAVSRQSWIRCSTISEYLDQFSPEANLKKLTSGSWIRGEFSAWIGHEAQNRAWEELLHVRRLVGPEGCRSIAFAEGSDWFWWLGPEHSSPQDPIFDRLFRSYLMEGYRSRGLSYPEHLKEPLKSELFHPMVLPTGWITPVVDGEVTSYFEWLKGGEVDLTHTSTPMARSRSSLSRLWWDCNSSQLYLRLDPDPSVFPEGWPAKERGLESHLTLTLRGDNFRIVLEFHRGVVNSTSDNDLPFQAKADRIAELAVPLNDLGVSPGEALELSITVEQEGFILERYPEYGVYSLALPLPTEAEPLWRA